MDSSSLSSFDELNLKHNLLKGIYSYGFEKPSDIQQKVIPTIITEQSKHIKRDIIAQAPSGTGKTGTYSIGILNSINDDLVQLQGLILLHTRELARQTYDVVCKMSKYTNIKTHACIGGSNVKDDVVSLQQGCHLIIGTPGRVLNMFSTKNITMDHMKLIVIDEADEMFNKGFNEQLNNIFQFNIPETTQIAIFSATITHNVIALVKTFMNDPIEILCEQEKLTLNGIHQFYVKADKDDQKLDIIIDLYSKFAIAQTIIFCNSKYRVDILCEKLTLGQFVVSSIHASMDMETRNDIVKKFRTGNIKILITTDILARGIDVQGVSFVINFDLPLKNKENYLHRIGRSGRYGRKGVSINIINDKEYNQMIAIQDFYKTVIDPLPDNFEDFLNN